MNAIDADQLMKFVDNFGEFYKQTYRYITGEGLRYAIGKFPVVEAEPVRHGAIISSNENGKSKRTFSCCNSDFTQLTMWMVPNYCPNCGAKMDLEAKEDETN